jgi:hypothetical protein
MTSNASMAAARPPSTAMRAASSVEVLDRAQEVPQRETTQLAAAERAPKAVEL